MIILNYIIMLVVGVMLGAIFGEWVLGGVSVWRQARRYLTLRENMGYGDMCWGDPEELDAVMDNLIAGREPWDGLREEVDSEEVKRREAEHAVRQKAIEAERHRASQPQPIFPQARQINGDHLLGLMGKMETEEALVFMINTSLKCDQKLWYHFFCATLWQLPQFVTDDQAEGFRLLLEGGWLIGEMAGYRTTDALNTRVLQRMNKIDNETQTTP